jgi:hypothetical protein
MECRSGGSQKATKATKRCQLSNDPNVTAGQRWEGMSRELEEKFGEPGKAARKK